MIITRLEFLARAELDHRTLELWIEEEWLIPSATENDLVFSEADVARARLIRDLIDDLGVNAEGVGVALHLLDQIHGLREAMAEVLRSIHGSEAVQIPGSSRSSKPRQD
jgi:chaperone modulatory protein CbpM